MIDSERMREQELQIISLPKHLCFGLESCELNIIYLGTWTLRPCFDSNKDMQSDAVALISQSWKR